MTRLARCAECGWEQPATGSGPVVLPPCASCGADDLRLVVRSNASPSRGGATPHVAAISMVALLCTLMAVVRAWPSGETPLHDPRPPASSEFHDWPKASEPPRLLSIDLGNEDYPAEAIRKEQEGTSQLRLLITPDGHVDRCVLSVSSGSELLDRAACEGVRTASFSPGRSSAGRPVRASVTVPITWRLPE